MNIILGSQSPRRRELLGGLNIPFTAISIDADEHFPASLQAGDIPLYISRAKAQAFHPQLTDNDLLITADTIVWADGQVLGKPHCEDDAIQMLHRLSGRTHQVYTAVTFSLRNANGIQCQSFVDCAHVTFEQLSDDDIAYYVTHFHPTDKAGAYGIQEWIGYIGVSSIQGSFYTVMGFPTHLVYAYLKNCKSLPTANTSAQNSKNNQNQTLKFANLQKKH